jgi:hypothetical protein
MNVLRASLVLTAALLYLTHVFQLANQRFWNAGLGSWLDPYFINALLEHWAVSLRHASDPSSPPMYFPVQKTLGYSHGLILYVPLYVPLRLFLHPFQAHNWTILLAVVTGLLCLYVLFRKLGLSVVESAAVTALFLTSHNVINESTGAWSQRVSVFLIPAILLLLWVSARVPGGRSKILLAGLTGFLATLMYVQDFYTAHLAFLFLIPLAVATAFVEGRVRRVREAIWRFGNRQTAASAAALITAALAAAWIFYLWMYGGGKVEVLDIRLRSTDVQRPALVAAVAIASFLWLQRKTLRMPRIGRPSSWLVALTLGAIAGALLFLWIYTSAYLEHPAFPENHLLEQLYVRDPSTWTGPLDALRGLKGYETLRPFALMLILAVLAWVPWIGAGRQVRIYALWCLGVSFVVLLIPLRVPDFSVWRAVVEPLPGFAAIRDPKRIIHVFELAAAIVTALFLASLPATSISRNAITLFLVCVIVTEPYLNRFHYGRSIATYERWVAAPMAIDPACRSFYIKRASDEYMARSDNMWGLYNIDSVFVALNHGLPTLNGYSAWFPDGWRLLNPQETGYDEEVQRWIDRHALTGVCEFDVAARTMTPRR